MPDDAEAFAVDNHQRQRISTSDLIKFPPDHITIRYPFGGIETAGQASGFHDGVHCVAIFELDLCAVERVARVEATLPALPTNSLLIIFNDDWIHAMPNVAAQVRQQRPDIVTQAPIAKGGSSSKVINLADALEDPTAWRKVSLTDFADGCCRIINTRGHLQLEKVACAHLETTIASVLMELDSQKKQALSLQQRRARIQKLRQLCSSEIDRLVKERKHVEELRSTLPAHAAVIHAQTQNLVARKEMISQEERKLEELRKGELRNANMRLRIRQRRMIAQLLQIYPIMRPGANQEASPVTASILLSMSASQHWTLRTIPLPNVQLASFDEETVSTALGYVAHLVFLVAKYLDVPLRYRIVYRASRSLICDDVQHFVQFPLFYSKVDQKHFECAVMLLNKNIQHLLNVRVPNWHKMAQHSQNTLENLDLLLGYECLR